VHRLNEASEHDVRHLKLLEKILRKRYLVGISSVGFFAIVVALTRFAASDYELQVFDPVGQIEGTVICVPGAGNRLPWASFTACFQMREKLLARGLRVISTSYPAIPGFDCSAIEEKASIIAEMTQPYIEGSLYVLGGSMGAWVAGRMEADAGILYGTGTEVVALAEGGW